MLKRVPAQVHTEYTDTLNAGEIIDVEPGQDGEEEQQVESYYLDGEEAFEKVLNSKVLIPEKDAKVLEGTSLRQKLYPLKKRARVRKIVVMEATAYYPGPGRYLALRFGHHGLRAQGRLWGSGGGYAVYPFQNAAIHPGIWLCHRGGRGGAIKGKKIDLCYDTYEEAVHIGNKNVKVYILR